MYLIENWTVNVRSSVFQFISSNRDINRRPERRYNSLKASLLPLPWSFIKE